MTNNARFAGKSAAEAAIRSMDKETELYQDTSRINLLVESLGGIPKDHSQRAAILKETLPRIERFMVKTDESHWAGVRIDLSKLAATVISTAGANSASQGVLIPQLSSVVGQYAQMQLRETQHQIVAASQQLEAGDLHGFFIMLNIIERKAESLEQLASTGSLRRKLFSSTLLNAASRIRLQIEETFGAEFSSNAQPSQPPSPKFTQFKEHLERLNPGDRNVGYILRDCLKYPGIFKNLGEFEAALFKINPRGLNFANREQNAIVVATDCLTDPHWQGKIAQEPKVALAIVRRLLDECALFNAQGRLWPHVEGSIFRLLNPSSNPMYTHFKGEERTAAIDLAKSFLSCCRDRNPQAWDDAVLELEGNSGNLEAVARKRNLSVEALALHLNTL